MKVKLSCEFRYPPDPADRGKAPKVAFKWTTPELGSYDAAKEAAKERAVRAGYTVRAANFAAEKGDKPTKIIVYVTKGK